MYGEHAGTIRANLTVLLRQHRIQQRIGGPGSHTVPETTTIVEREALGQQIARYRQAVLVWCLQATRAGSPPINLNGTTESARGPAEQLATRLTEAIAASGAGLPPIEELTTPQQFPILETWRHAARAAALGEHDFSSGVGEGRLSHAQAKSVLRDAAEITRALSGLDRRYKNIPGWNLLKDPGRLARAAESCAVFAHDDHPDYSVDTKGWRPPPRLDHGPARPGLSGIAQAEHNLLVHLGQFPDARSLRLILDSQRIVSHQTAIRLQDADPQVAATWEARTATYTALVRETRDLGGLIGNGRPAAAQASVAAARARDLPPGAPVEGHALRQLDELYQRIDNRIADVIEHGVTERLYFTRIALPQIDAQANAMIQPVRTRYVPLNYPLRTDLIPVTRDQLRAAPPKHSPSPEARRNRHDFETAITHRPEGRGTGPAVSL